MNPSQKTKARRLVGIGKLMLHENPSGKHKGQKCISKWGRGKPCVLLSKLMMLMIRYVVM
ncbi:MAG TPA: hypothetical protein VNR61_00655 [Niallia sp.]|nr:hypothetical protein [Niallia sp.]